MTNVNDSTMQSMAKTTFEAEMYMPSIKVSFHTKDKCYHAKGGAKNKYGEKLDPLRQVLSISTQKSLSSPAGSFTLSLAGHQWRNYVTSNDIVVIEMGYVGEKHTTVMVGLIDSVNVKRNISATGEPSVMTYITGRDFGKLFVKDLLKFYPQIDGVTNKSSSYFLTDVGWVNLMKVFASDSIMKGSPAVIIDNIMRFIFMKFHDTKWVVYDESGKKKQTVQAGQIIRYFLGKLDFFMPFMMTADQYEGALWNMLERASVAPFSELFIDVRSSSEAWNPSAKNRVVPHEIEEMSNLAKGKLAKNKGRYPAPAFKFGEDKAQVCLVLRETPFDSDVKKNLIAHEIKPIDVISEDLTQTDSEHYNLFWAGTTVNPLGIDLKNVCPPLLNEDDASRYGLSPLEVNIEGLSISQDKKKKSAETKTLEGMTKKYTAKLKAWFEKNHEYWNGTLEIRGKADIRIGHRIFYDGSFTTKHSFYVEGVQQSYNVFDGWTTTLTVTRGMPVTNKVDSKKETKKTEKPTKPTATTKTNEKPKDTYYVVKRGDTLWALADTYYKNNLEWRKIWDANKEMLIKRDSRNAKDYGHWIYPGQKLRIPPK